MENKKQNEGIDLRQKKIFAQNLRYYLDKTGKLQREVSDALKISQCSVSDWMNLRSYPRMNKIQQMAELFGCEISDLIEEHSLDNKNYALKISEEFINDPQAYELYRKIKALSERDREAVEMLIDRLGGGR